MEFPGNFIGTQNTANTNYLSGVHSLYEVGQGVSDGTWPTNYKIKSSLRFNGTSNYLTRTPSSLGNRRTFTISFWFKKCSDDSFPRFQQRIDTNSSQQFTVSGYSTNNNFRILDQSSSTNKLVYHYNGAQRDTNHWMHVVAAIDTTQEVASERQKLFLNGVFQPIDDGTGTPAAYDRFYETSVNNTSSNRLLIGCQRPNSSATLSSFFDGYLAEYYLVDGLQLDASYFGSFHPTTGQWLPERYTGEFGVNGFYLDFEGTSEFVSSSANRGSICEDKSGNDNHFSFSGLSQHLVTPDSPTNNFCMWDRQNLSTASLLNNNLRMEGGGNYTGGVGNIAVPPKGHWYMEIRTNDATSDMMWGGVPVTIYRNAELQSAQWAQLPYGIYSTSYGSGTSQIDTAIGTANGGNQITLSGVVSVAATTTGDVLGYGFDFDTGEIHVSKNGTHMTTHKGWVPANDDFYFGYQVHATWPVVDITVNWGQDPTFNGTEGAAATNRIYSDANGLGKFLYEPPAGALAVCSDNIDKIKNQPTTYISDETNRHQYDNYYGSMRTSQFSPYIKGGYSINFDGDDDIIDTADNAGLSLDGAANNDFTIELWYFFMEDPSSSYYAGIFSKWGGDSDKEFAVHAYENRTIQGSISSDASGNYTNFTTDKGLLKGKWNHIAFVGNIVDDGDLYCWINGNRALAKTDFSSYNTSGTKSSGMRVGFYANATYSRAAIISDFRMVSGLMVYDKTATTIDVPTEPLKNISGGSGTDAYTTALLLSANSPRFVDTGANSLALTVTNAPKIEDFSPYTTREPSMSHPAIKAPARDISLTGGSFTTLGGNQGYLFYPDSDDFSMGATDFTLECWVYCIDSGTRRFFWGVGASSGANAAVAYSFEYTTDQKIQFFAYTTDATSYSMKTTATIEENTWNHIAAVRYNDHLTVYINGVDGGDTSGTGGGVSGKTFINGSNKMSIGTLGEYISEGHQGYVTDLRITKGKAVYTGAFTPPTSPLSALSKTVFLARPYSKVKKSLSVYKNSHRYTRDEIGDGVNKDRGVTHSGRLFHGKVISDTSPYSKGDDIGSFVFDGIDDRVIMPTIPALGTSDWTLEFWFKELIDVSESYSGLVSLSASTDANKILTSINSGTLHFYIGEASWRNSSWAPTTGKWHHIAFVRDYDAGLKFFVDGEQRLHYTSSDISARNYDQDLGGSVLHNIGYWSNYNNMLITDVRFTKQVLYTGTGNDTYAFTTPKYPLSTDKYVTDGTDQSATGPSTTTTYTVTVASGIKYDGTSGNRYLIDGEPFDTVTLHRGSTYRFDVSDSSFGSNAHPFRFSSNENNSPSAAYTTGVTTSGDGGSAGAYVEIVVANDAPDNLYYYCTNHSGMGGTIKVEGGRTITAGNALMLLQPGKKEQKSEVFELASMNRLNYSSADTNVANNGYSTLGSQARSIHSSFSVSSGKWYVEASGTGSSGAYIGVQEANTASPAPVYNTSMSTNTSQGIGLWTQNGQIYGGNGTGTLTPIQVSGTGPALASTDVVAMAIDMDASPKTVQWLVNNTRVITVKLGSNQYIAQDGTTGTASTTFADISNLYVTYNNGGAASLTADWNFGQDPSILGNVTPSGGTNADNGFPDEDGRGSFRYAPPAGYKAMGRFQKPAQIVSDAAQHPEKHFNTILYQGTAYVNAITGLDFKPDFVWVKNRSNSTGYHHAVYDSVRGVNKTLRASSTGAEIASTAQLMSFDDRGFTVGDNSDSGNYVNLAGDDYVAWCWKAGDTIVPNTRGTNPSNVSVNKDAGFSIVSWVSSGGTTSSNYIGHGLDETPEAILIKDRDSTENWHFYTNVVDNSHDYFFLDSTDNKADSGYTAPTSDYFYWASNEDNHYIAYCWHSVPGFSKIGKYVGTGTLDRGFVYTGFKPAWVMLKHASGSVGTTYSGWLIVDSKRSSVNPVGTTTNLWANYSIAEGLRGDGTSAHSGVGALDFLANGFRIRDTSSDEVNDPSDTYIYMAFAEAPFTRTSAK